MDMESYERNVLHGQFRHKLLVPVLVHPVVFLK